MCLGGAWSGWQEALTRVRLSTENGRICQQGLVAGDLLSRPLFVERRVGRDVGGASLTGARCRVGLVVAEEAGAGGIRQLASQLAAFQRGQVTDWTFGRHRTRRLVQGR